MDNSLETHGNASVGSSDGSNGLPTSKAASHHPSPDVVRIYVPYGVLSSTTASYQDDLPRTLLRSLETNKIRIKVDPGQTPTFESYKPFNLESPELELDLK